MDKVWLPGVQTDQGMDLTSWMRSIINNTKTMHIYHQVSEWDWGMRLENQTQRELHNHINAEKPDNVRFIFGCGDLVRWPQDGTDRAHSPMTFRHLFPGWDDAVVQFEHSFMLNASWHFSSWNDIFVRSREPQYLSKYVCMMNKPHWHRKKLLQILLDLDPDLDGYVTWCPQERSWQSFLENHQETPGLLERLMPHMHKLQHQGEHPALNYNLNFFDVPKCYGDCFIDIVSESSTDVVYFTEKTVRPLVFGKPFILLGAPGANHRLRQLGFQLFDELFDYSLEPLHGTDHDQYDWYSEIIKPVFSLTKNDMIELDHIWQRVYRANKQLLKHIVMTDDYIPEILKPEIYEDNIHFPNYHRDIHNLRQRMLEDSIFNKI